MRYKLKYSTALEEEEELKYHNAVEALPYLTINNVTTEDSCNRVVNELRRRIKKHKAIGFDCEWVTVRGKRQPVALLQLSSFDGYCGLFRLCQLKTIPQSLKEFLEDDSIYKVGVAPFDDAKYLLLDYSVAIRSTLDLRHIVRFFGHVPGGLAFLAKSHLRIILDKSWRVRCSDWEAQELTETQIKYAAADAHVAVKIFVNLVDRDHGCLWKWFNITGDDTNWSDINEICSKFADVGFTAYSTSSWRNERTKKVKKWKQEKEVRASRRYLHALRTKPLYHNCFLLAPDGELLCTCDVKKAEWYVEKGLADLASLDPMTVRLRFEPAGRSVGDVGRYYQLTKENKCVVCGGHNSYIRKNVVPREYRRYFPEIMKEHSSHDVVLLCVGCHQRSNALDQAVRERLAADCGAPLSTHPDGKYKEDVESKKVRSAARALLYQTKKHVLPESKRKQLESIVLPHFPQYEEVTEELLQLASDIQVVFENADFESHGHRVVEYYLKHDGLLELERLWREHFLRSMRPKYMPELWSVRHNAERLLVRFQEGRLSEESAKLLGRKLPKDSQELLELQEDIQQLEEKLREKHNELFKIKRNKYRSKPTVTKSKPEAFVRPQKIMLQNSIHSIQKNLELMSMLSGMEVQSYAAGDHCCIMYHLQHDAEYEVKHCLRIEMKGGKNEVTKCSFPLGFNFKAVTEEFDNIMMPACLSSIKKALIAYYDRFKQFEELQKLLNVEAQLFKKLDTSHIEISFFAETDMEGEDEPVVLHIVLMLDYRVYDVRPKTYCFNEDDLPEDAPKALRSQCAEFRKKPLQKAFKEAFMDGVGRYRLMQQLKTRVREDEIRPEPKQRTHKRFRPNKQNYNNDDTFLPEECSDQGEDDEVVQ
ncbi:unnamed protein product, partial [Iphiclides podalirius]